MEGSGKRKNLECQTVRPGTQLSGTGAKARNWNPKRDNTEYNLFQIEQKKPSGKIEVPKWNKCKDVEKIRVQNRNNSGSDTGKYG